MPSAQAPGLRSVFRAWWPLAASWVLMAAELPAVSAVVARLPDPVINLAAYGGIVFPLALLIESPIIMLLSASTALSKDWASYVLMRRFMMWASAALTLLHVVVAFTPLYYVVVEGLLGAPPEIVEPGRIGLQIMVPWTWSIAFRRFNQGVLIRFGHSRSVGVGTLFRLGADLLLLAIGYSIGTLPGIVVATLAVASGVVCEAIYTGLRVRPVLLHELKPAPPVQPPLTYRAFFGFYFPLVMTALMMLLVQPIGTAAVSRMPGALASLAVWPVLSGLLFLVRAPGLAYNEVVVALLDQPGEIAALRRFAYTLAAVATAVLVVLTATPLAKWWFEELSALEPALSAMALAALWLAFPLPALSVAQSWFQGIVLHVRRTRIISEAVGLYLATMIGILVAGVSWGKTAGVFVALGALVLGALGQVAWLAWRSRFERNALWVQDSLAASVQA